MAKIKGHNSDTNMRKMMRNNRKQDLAKMNADIKFGEILKLVLKILSGNEILAQIKDNNSGKNERKMTCNNPKPDPVNMNAYIKFGENMSVSSEDIEQKQKFGVNQGP